MFKRKQQAVSISEPARFVGLSRWLKITVTISLVVSAIGWGYVKLLDPETLPITKVRALGDFSFVTEKMLHQAMTDGVDNTENKDDILENKGFFNIDVDAIKKRVETMPWVRQASVQRVWPDTLIIEIVEQQAVAYWNDKGLVNTAGMVFYPDKRTFPKGLPRFIAAEGFAEKCLRYLNDAREIFAGIKVDVNKVKFNARQALSLTLSNGVELNLGRQNKLYRLQRFSQVYSALSERVSLIEYVDMRYTNGFSVKWKQQVIKGQLHKKLKSNKANV